MLIPVLLILTTACGKGEFPASTSSDSSLDKTTLLHLLNEVRKKGCRCGDTWYGPSPALSWNGQLESAAYLHSKDMAQKKYFSHDAPDGTDAGDRIRKAGYNWMVYAENIGMGYQSERAAVEAWLKSPGHCRNIMNQKYRDAGAAQVAGYWTLKLASK